MRSDKKMSQLSSRKKSREDRERDLQEQEEGERVEKTARRRESSGWLLDLAT